MWWFYLKGDETAALFNSLSKGPSCSELRLQLDVCIKDYVKLGLEFKLLTHFVPATVFTNNVFGNQRPFCSRDQAVLSQTYSPHTCPSVRCCSGWVRERLCLLWRWSESCGIPASSPTQCKEPLHRCSPKVNEAPWFCGSSVLWNEVLFCPGMNFFESLNFSPILLIHKCRLI